MIACSGCHSTLPDWVQKCQFCGTDVTKVARPIAAVKTSQPLRKVEAWIWPAYYVLSLWWVISGLSGAYETYHTAVTPVTIKMFGMSETSTPGFGVGSIIGFTVAAFNVIVGLGLACRVELARGVANFLAAVNILFGLLGLAGSLAGTLVMGPYGLILAIINTVNIIVGGLTIYVIGETEKHAPNF